MRFIVLLILGLLASQTTESASNDAKPYYDFFRKLIQKQKKPRRRLPVRTKIKTAAPKPVIPDLKMTIHGISGEEGMRTAIVTFEREQLLLTEGQEQTGKFKVIKIDTDKITLLHIKAGKRQEISI